MKKLLLPAFIVLLGASPNVLKAQPTLTAANTNLQVGDQFLMSEVTFGATEFTAGASAGANKTWNLASLTSQGSQQAMVLARSAAPKASSYPAANMVIKVGDQFAYYENNGTSMKEHAAYESVQNYSLENTDPAEKFRFPITYNNTFTDAFAGTLDAAGTQIPRNGTVTVTAEGYGTLTTAGGTFQNVLKIKTEEVANPFSMYSENTITYDWYAPGIHFPLLRLTRRITLLGTDYSGFFIYTVLGTKEDLAARINYQIFPNPATKSATIQFDQSKTSNTNLTVTNLVGQQMAHIRIEKSGPEMASQKLDLSGYPKGIYLVQLETEGKLAVKRLVVE
jgi:hypothetical protein